MSEQVDYLFELKQSEIYENLGDIATFSFSIEKLKRVIQLLIEKHKETRKDIKYLNGKAEQIDE